MCGLAHYFERAGIPAVAIALVPQHARKIRPPRALAVPFELGRPLGVPGDAEFQLAVLRAALSLLTSDSPEPVYREYECELPRREEGEQAWACPVSFPRKQDDEASWDVMVRQEIELLRPWYDKSVKAQGRTTASVSGIEVEEIPGFIVQFVSSSGREKLPAGMTPGDALKWAAEDLKAFYNEAAVAQPGNATSREIEHWYWNQSSAGKMIREVSAHCSEHPDPGVRVAAGFLLVPQSQVKRS